MSTELVIAMVALLLSLLTTALLLLSFSIWLIKFILED